MALSGIISEIKRDISRKSQIFHTPAFDAHDKGSRRNVAMRFGMKKKLELCGYTRWKKFEDMITRFDTIHERDGQTDGQMDWRTPHYDIGRAFA